MHLEAAGGLQAFECSSFSRTLSAVTAWGAAKGKEVKQETLEAQCRHTKLQSSPELKSATSRSRSTKSSRNRSNSKRCGMRK